MPDLEYTIKTAAELSGAEATARSLEMQIGKAKALKEDYTALQKQLDLVKDSLKNAPPEINKVTEAEGKLEVGKRELVESMHELTRQYPILAEVARASFNPLTILMFSLGEAFSIVMEKAKASSEIFGGMELPPLGEHIKEVEGTATAYDGLARAVHAANDEFNGSAAAFERQSGAISAQLAATKQLIDAQKQKALADLDLQRAGGQIGPAAYEARKSMIEQGYNDRTTQAEIDARNLELRARQQEARGLARDAAAKSAEASGVKLPESDADVQAQIDDLKARATALREQAKQLTVDKEKAQDLAVVMQPGQGLGQIPEVLRNVPEAAEFAFHYGSADPEDVARIAGNSAREAEDNAKAAELAASRVEEKKKKRDKLRSDAEALARQAQEKSLALQGEGDPNKPGSVAWQNAQAAAAQGIRDTASGSKRLAGDLDAFDKDRTGVANDLKHGDVKDARKTVADMSAALTDAAGLIGDLARNGGDVADIQKILIAHRREIDALNIKLSQVRASSDLH